MMSHEDSVNEFEIPTSLRRRLAKVLAGAGFCGLGIWVWVGIQGQIMRRNERQKRLSTPFNFPFASLAALDRDVQTRFAVVPDKDFGMGRIGRMHELYVPVSSQEEATMRALKKQRVQAAFYVMSRRIWRGEAIGFGSAPLQGPVYLTPPPRGFKGRKMEDETVVDSKNGKFTARKIARYVNPDGTPVPAPLAPPDLPDAQEMLALGSRVFELTGEVSPDVRTGKHQTLGSGHWRVAAVPVRASDQACVNCHNGNGPGRETVALGDALGVAFYAYRPIGQSK